MTSPLSLQPGPEAFCFSSLDPAPWSTASPRGSQSPDADGPSQSADELQAAATALPRSINPTSQPAPSPTTPASAINASDLALLAHGTSRSQVPMQQDMGHPVPSTEPQSLNTLLSNLRPAPVHATKLMRSTTAASSNADSPPKSRVMSPAHTSPRQHVHGGLGHNFHQRPASPATASGMDTGVALQGHGMLSYSSNAMGPRQRPAPEQPDWQHCYPQQQQHARGPTNAVDELLGRYHLTNQMPMALHMRTQRQIGQLRQYQQIKEQLQATQVTMLGGMGTVQGGPSPPGQDMPATSATEILQAAQRNATKGTGSPSMARFNSKSILQEGMYVSSGDYSFAASLPMRNTPTASLLFERYAGSDEAVPTVQRYYLRPDRPSRPKSPPVVSYAPPRAPPSGRRLPNGIPVCRLHSEQVALRKTKLPDSGRPSSARPGSHSPHTPQLIMHPHNSTLSMDQQIADVVGSLGAHGDQGEATKILTPRDAGNAANVLNTLGAASTLGAATAEPVLDDPFAALVKSHFTELAAQQSKRLQNRLNAGLPVILHSMGVNSACLTTR